MFEIIFIINPKVTKANNCAFINKFVKIIIVKVFVVGVQCALILIVTLNLNIEISFFLINALYALHPSQYKHK